MKAAMPSIAAVAMAVALAASEQEAKSVELSQAFERRLQSIAASLDGVMGYSILDLTSGRRFGRLDTDVFPTASTIKIAILYELFRQADEGRIRIDDARPLDRAAAVGGSGVLRELTAPSMPLRDYATLMIVLSDNTATNVVIDAVGMPSVTARMRTLGLKDTRLRRKMIDLEAARRGDENVSTPADLVKLLELVYRGDGLAKRGRDEVLAILKKDKQTAMRRGIPAGVEVANKPGGLDGVAVDAGIVLLKDRPYILAAMTTFLQDEQAGDMAITNASRAAYEYFARLAKSSEYGRTIR